MTTQTIETTKTIKTVSKDDANQIVDTLVLAFSADPAVRWMYPNPHHYLTHFPNFVRVQVKPLNAVQPVRLITRLVQHFGCTGSCTR